MNLSTLSNIVAEKSSLECFVCLVVLMSIIGMFSKVLLIYLDVESRHTSSSDSSSVPAYPMSMSPNLRATLLLFVFLSQAKHSGTVLNETLLALDSKEPTDESSSIATNFDPVVLSDMLSQSSSH